MGLEKRQPLPLQQTREGQSLATSIGARQDHSRAAHDSDRQLGTSTAGETSITIAATGTAVVQHRLGHEPTGWSIIDRDAAGSVWRTTQDRYTLTLQTDAATPITVKVEVF